MRTIHSNSMITLLLSKWTMQGFHAVWISVLKWNFPSNTFTMLFVVSAFLQIWIENFCQIFSLARVRRLWIIYDNYACYTQTKEAFLPEKVILVCCLDHVQLRFSSIMHASYTIVFHRCFLIINLNRTTQNPCELSDAKAQTANIVQSS